MVPSHEKYEKWQPTYRITIDVNSTWALEVLIDNVVKQMKKFKKGQSLGLRQKVETRDEGPSRDGL